MQAAADAASARLKAWLVGQKALEGEKKQKKLIAEEEKRQAALEILKEAERVNDRPRRRLELIEQLCTYVAIDCHNLAVSTAEDVLANERYARMGPLGSFSSRAVEAHMGSIGDFVTVLTAPGEYVTRLF